MRDVQNLVVIEPERSGFGIDLSELWRHRELLYFLAWRDVKVRYRQTLLGVIWAVLQPLLTMVVFSVFLGGLVGVPTNGAPYPLFVFAALLPWQLFAHSLTQSSNSLVTNQQLVTKVYFPRLILPVAATLAGLVDFAIACAILLALLLLYGVTPTTSIVLLPAFTALALASALAVGFWLTALNAQYRDVQYTIPFLVQLWLFVTPVAYPSSLIPAQWRVVYALNPMVGVVDGFRWALLGDAARPDAMIAVSAIVVALIFITGLAYFQRVEATLADVV